MSCNEAKGVWTVGVDCGEQRHRAVVLDDDGRRLSASWLANRFDDIEAWLFELLNSLPDGYRLRIATEGTRSLGGILMQVAVHCGVEVWQVHSKALDSYRAAEGQPRKTDDWDAYLLARMVINRIKGCRLALDPQPEERRLCRLSRLHRRLTGEITKLFNQIRSRLIELCPEVVGTDWPGPGPKSKGMHAVLRRWPAFAGLERAHVSTIEKLLRSATRGGDRCAEMAVALKQVASDIHMSDKEREVIALELDILLDDLSTTEASLKRVREALEADVAAHPIGPKLLAMVAVGYTTAATLIGEALPLARNLPEGNVATYCGQTPLSRRSARMHGRSRLARGVNKYLSHALFMSSVAATRHSAIDRMYYDKKRQDYAGHPRPHTAATIALARQRLKVMYKLMTTDAVYDKEVILRHQLERQQRAQLQDRRR